MKFTSNYAIQKEMNFYELQAVVAHLKRSIRCHDCQRRFKLPDFTFMTTVDNEGIVRVDCLTCRAEGYFWFAVNKISQEEFRQQIQNGTLGAAQGCHPIAENPITFNEVLDIQNFLKGFKGDFKKVL